MVQARTSAKEFFNADERLADLGLIAVPGAEELTAKIDRHLLRWAQEAGMDQDTFIIESECPRFSSGDGKGLIRSTVRGDDIYFVVDVGNYNQKYKIFGHENFMSPDDHFQNLKRLIQATSGKAKRMSVIMPPTGKAWTAPSRCRSCRPWASPTSSPLTPTTPACRTPCP